METTTVAEYAESTTVTLEWTLRGLKTIFDSSKGESKSKVTKSARFGADGRWQVLFYANSGTGGVVSNTESGGYISLYLSCEPTLAEKEAAVNGQWVREGHYNFRFELRPVGKSYQFSSKEAHNRSFSQKTLNLGWAQFAQRDLVYYQAPSVKGPDAFTIICTITSCSTVPVTAPNVPRQSVPKDIMDSIGGLLDDPLYSDVEFVLPGSGRRGFRDAKRIYANSKLLKRAEYFETMFASGFSEAVPSGGPDYDDGLSTSFLSSHVDDSDAEDDPDAPVGLDALGDELDFDDVPPPALKILTLPSVATPVTPRSAVGGSAAEQPEEDSTEGRNVRQKLEHPSSPRTSTTERPIIRTEEELIPAPRPTVPGPKKMTVVVQDASYWTYRAVLYWIYTDSIVFAPLSSSFLSPNKERSGRQEGGHGTMTPAATEGGPFSFPLSRSVTQHAGIPGDGHGNGSGITAYGPLLTPGIGIKSRNEWIHEWELNNSCRPRPCSAKSVYRLADRLDLTDLKDRAFQHIVKSLTVDNVPYEVFSTFSATFEEIRKVEIQFFLNHWSEIRGSDGMRHVWQQIRVGRHPGFEEVWPLIAVNLEFKAPTAEETVPEPSAVAS